MVDALPHRLLDLCGNLDDVELITVIPNHESPGWIHFGDGTRQDRILNVPTVFTHKQAKKTWVRRAGVTLTVPTPFIDIIEGTTTDNFPHPCQKSYGNTWDYFSIPMHYNQGLATGPPMPWWSRLGPGGPAIIEDDFEGTLRWTGTGGTVTKASDPGCVLTGNSNMKLVIGSVAGNAVSAQIALGDLRSDRERYDTFKIDTDAEGFVKPGYNWLGLEFWFMLKAALDTTPRDFYIKVQSDYDYRNTRETWGIRYKHYETTGQFKWYRWGSGGTWDALVVPFLPSKKIDVINNQFVHVALRMRRDVDATSPPLYYGYEDINNYLGYDGNGVQVAAMGAIQGETI